MKISPQGIDLIIAREGKRNAAYPDSRGIPTIGVGHTGPEVHLGLVWTDEQVRAALAHDLGWVEAELNALPCALEQFQADALGSFIFNIGGPQFRSSTMRRMLCSGLYEEAAKQFDRWHIPAEITSRRNGEREQFKGEAFEARIEDAHHEVIA